MVVGISIAFSAKAEDSDLGSFLHLTVPGI